MSGSSSPKDLTGIDESPKIDKRIKNFSANLKARAKADARATEQVQRPTSSTPTSFNRSDSAASTIRPDSVLSFRSEIPNVKQSDFGAFRPESASILPPDTVTTIRPDSVAAVHGAGQGVFRPFQAPSGPTARFNIQYQATSETDWEAKDEMRQRELEEMRARAAQMEKTMRWWSDCTANWREKWSKVRNERNKAREDCRQLRSKLEVVVKECTNLKRGKQDLIAEIDKLKAELEVNLIKDPDKDSDSMSTGSSVSIRSQPDEFAGNDDSNGEASSSPEKQVAAGMTEAKLRELTKIYNAEKEERDGMKCKLDDLHLEIRSLKTELSDASAENAQLQARIDSLQEVQQQSVKGLSEDYDSSDKAQHQVMMLREQLERMQVENAAEWAKREKLSSQKHSLERENKKLRSLLEDVQGEARDRNRGQTSIKDQDIKSLQDELTNRNREFSELRQSFSKQKKQLQETSTELNHSTRRADQYEHEVKKLRARIEELKDDLISAENEVDTQSNIARKLQRNCDNLQESSENCQAQMAHLQSRAFQ
ncbi:coiled-coil domain-containing protein 102A-like isoform X2 [Watersipora subatra]|uniref:coiled-coil domain-containing protein 102A-like isoform X2 n=1 Tax=Watersipora subatra TaxID=2589382 RepID=UPI00355B4C1C